MFYMSFTLTEFSPKTDGGNDMRHVKIKKPLKAYTPKFYYFCGKCKWSGSERQALNHSKDVFCPVCGRKVYKWED